MKKPWISKGILKSIEKRTEFAEHALELKMVQKEELHNLLDSIEICRIKYQE